MNWLGAVTKITEEKAIPISRDSFLEFEF